MRTIGQSKRITNSEARMNSFRNSVRVASSNFRAFAQSSGSANSTMIAKGARVYTKRRWKNGSRRAFASKPSFVRIYSIGLLSKTTCFA